MKKSILQRVRKNAVLAVTAVFYLAAVAMFSFMYTQN